MLFFFLLLAPLARAEDIQEKLEAAIQSDEPPVVARLQSGPEAAVAADPEEQERLRQLAAEAKPDR